MKIAVSGASGLVGRALVNELEAKGHQVLKLVRSDKLLEQGEVYWNPVEGQIQLEKLEGLDCVFHLAGENVAQGSWTEEKKRSIRESRVLGTCFLVSEILKLEKKPKVWINASAIGFYGSRGDKILDESSQPGTGFLADVCREWEEETLKISQHMRLVVARIGVVMSCQGGALKKMLTPFRLGFGGKTGSGAQYFSWISISDVVKILIEAMTNDSIRGPINVVSPNSCTNLEFARTLAWVLKRPSFFSLPTIAVKLFFGEMGDDLLLSSTRVTPKRLLEMGFEFENPNLEEALSSILEQGD